MPRLDQDQDDMQTFNIAGKGGYAFTGARFDKLGASSYTLVQIALDVSSSVGPFRQQLIDTLKAVIEACRKNPRSDNMMVRLILISGRFNLGVEEVHGFKQLADIDLTSYDSIRTGGNTPLTDGCYSGVGSLNTYAEQLKAQDYDSNGIAFFITDGAETGSVATLTMLKNQIEKAVTSEKGLESLISILVGINTDMYDQELQDFQKAVGITHYKKAGEATPRNLAKLAEFVSQSVSSQSQALGTGGPSQQIAATI